MVFWVSILATIALFYPIHSGAALVLVPYLAWVSFAAALNFAGRVGEGRDYPAQSRSEGRLAHQ